MRDLTDLRAADERYADLNAQSAQVTLNRLHLASNVGKNAIAPRRKEHA
jgi:hypothetical protein